MNNFIFDHDQNKITCKGVNQDSTTSLRIRRQETDKHTTVKLVAPILLNTGNSGEDCETYILRLCACPAVSFWESSLYSLYGWITGQTDEERDINTVYYNCPSDY